MSRDRILNGVLDVQAVLSELSETEAAIVFSRLVEGFEDPDADAAVGVLKSKAEAAHMRLHGLAQRHVRDLADGSLDVLPPRRLPPSMTSTRGAAS